MYAINSMKRELKEKKIACLRQYRAWLQLKIKFLNFHDRARYCRFLEAIDVQVQKKTGASLLLQPNTTLILQLIQGKNTKLSISQEKVMILMHYLFFLLSSQDESCITKDIYNLQLSPNVNDFAKWIKTYIGGIYEQWRDSSFWQQSSLYTETSIKKIIDTESIIAPASNDNKISAVYAAYLFSLAFNSIQGAEALNQTTTQTGHYQSKEDAQIHSSKCKAFSEWLSTRNAAQTCAKYLSVLYGINATAIRVLHHSLLNEQSIDNVTAILKTLISSSELKNIDRKVAALYLSYLTQQDAVEADYLSGKVKTIKPSKTDFENWLVSFIGMGRAYARAYVLKAEEISTHLSPIGFSLFTVNSTFELKSLEPIFKLSISNSLILALDYYYAYMYSAMTNIEETKIGPDKEDETKGIQKQKQCFEAWCLEKEIGQTTIKSMQEFIVELSAYCKSHELTFNSETDTDIVNVSILLDLYTNQQAYNELFTSSWTKNYVDRYCLYLLGLHSSAEISSILTQKNNQSQHPFLIVADKKRVAAKFKNWLIEKQYCNEGSARTFVSSLYSCENLVREHFNDSIMENPYKRKIAYLRLLALEKTQFKTYWAPPLRLFIQFLSEFHIISEEEHLANLKKINNFILEQFDGIIPQLFAHDYRSICAALNGANNPPLQYSEDDILDIVELLTIHDKPSNTLILRDAFIPEAVTAQLIQYIESVFEAGCPVVDYEEVRKRLPKERQATHNDTLRQFLNPVGKGIFTCEAKCVRAIDSCKKSENIQSIIADKLREINKPIFKDELVALLPSISEGIITRILSQNNLGINTGIVHPKREKIFHADIVEITKTEKTDIISVIFENLHLNYYITASQLHKLIKSKVPRLFKKYTFLTKGALFRVLRYKLSEFFNFSISCVTFSGTVDMLSIFKSYFTKHKKVKLAQLMQFEKELGATNIPFEQIYETHARVNHEDFVKREHLHFDIPAIDSVLEKICTQPLLPIGLFNDYSNLPLVSGFEWTPFLLEHYLTYHSKKFFLCKRNFSRRGCYGFIIQQPSDINDFDDATARYLWLSNIELNTGGIIERLYEVGVIGVRKYANIEHVIQRVRELQNFLSTPS